MMGNPYATLGVPPTASAAQIRGAYHSLVKQYHPDTIRDPVIRETAQEKLVEINLAYEKALQSANAAQSADAEVIPDAKKVAASLFDRGQYDAALRILSHSMERDAEWFFLQGRILLALRKPSPAHESFRAAIRLAPDNPHYRQGALDAAVAVRKVDKTPANKFVAWIRKRFRR